MLLVSTPFHNVHRRILNEILVVFDVLNSIIDNGSSIDFINNHLYNL